MVSNKTSQQQKRGRQQAEAEGTGTAEVAESVHKLIYFNSLSFCKTIERFSRSGLSRSGSTQKPPFLAGAGAVKKGLALAPA